MSEQNSDLELLNIIIELAPTIQKLVPLDCTIGVADTINLIYTVPGEKIKIPKEAIGKDMPKDDAIYQAIHSGKSIDTIVSAAAFGFPFKACGMPIRNKAGNIIGGLGLGISLENTDKLINAADTVVKSTEKAFSTIKELALSTEESTKNQLSLKALSVDIEGSINSTKSIVDFINGVTKTSKLLALNASIESARAGEAGRGFSVVAKEISKMADNSANGIKEIESTLNTIKEKISQIAIKINETVDISEQQASATEEISSLMKELVSSADLLNDVAKNVIG